MKVNYVSRVTQLDALQLDSEILKILKESLNKVLVNFSPGVLSLHQPELDLMLRSLIWYYSIGKSNATFGQQLLQIQYDSDVANNSKLLMHYLLSIGLNYAKEKAEYSFTSMVTLQRVLFKLETFVTIGNLFNFFRFLKSGKMPTLPEYVLGLEHVAMIGTPPRIIGYSHMTRELLWASFLELLLYVLPLIKYHTWKSKIKQWLPWKKNLMMKQTKQVVSFSVSTTCATCKDRPTLPHSMGCQHVFCYYCLKGNQLADNKYECPVCDYLGEAAQRVIIA